jgi:hypothetical protein
MLIETGVGAAVGAIAVGLAGVLALGGDARTLIQVLSPGGTRSRQSFAKALRKVQKSPQPEFLR